MVGIQMNLVTIIKGDLVILEDNEEHTPISSEKTGCICIVYSGSLKFKGLLGSILNLSKF